MFPVGVYKVEDYPLNWIAGTYYSTYKDNTFQVASIENVKSEADYAAVTEIELTSESLTTDFNFLHKFINLDFVNLSNNLISNIDFTSNLKMTNITIRGHQLTNINVNNNVLLENMYVGDGLLNSLDIDSNVLLEILEAFNNNLNSIDLSNNILLKKLLIYNNNLNSVDVSNNTLLEDFRISGNSISTIDVSNNNLISRFQLDANSIANLDISNLVNLTHLQAHNNQLTAATNSQILIDLDNHGLSNGLFRSTIFGGGSLTAAGQTAKANLQAKGWNIIGV